MFVLALSSASWGTQAHPFVVVLVLVTVSLVMWSSDRK